MKYGGREGHELGQQEELEALCGRIRHLDLPEVAQDVIAPDVREISQEGFVDLLCEKFREDGAGPVVLDVRSESEYARDGVPAAVSLPILGDQERHEVGLLYRRHSHHTALRYALYLAVKKEMDYVRRARELAGGRPLVLYCWRGGGRSAYAAGLLERHGMDVVRLSGGWKGFRRQVQRLLYHGEFTLWPLSGATGCGKSEVLELLEARYPEIPVLHLEAAAGHAASVFGHLRRFSGGVSLAEDQQQFETRLYFSLLRRRRPDGGFPPFVTEMESRRIGAVQVPPALFRALERGPHIRLEAAMENRVRRLQREYFGEGNEGLAGVRGALTYLTRRVGGQVVRRWEALLDAGDTRTFLREILEGYYDRGYREDACLPACTVRTDDLEAAVRGLVTLWREWRGAQDGKAAAGAGTPVS